MSHMPGPWSLQPIGDETECNILGAGRELIATVSDNDARLIAAAPEMLAFLEKLLLGRNNWDLPDRLVPEARALLAKIEGQ